MKTIELSIYSNLIAPKAKWEYYSIEEIRQHLKDGFIYAVIDTSYNQFPKAHCVKIEDYNKAIDEYLSAEE